MLTKFNGKILGVMPYDYYYTTTIYVYYYIFTVRDTKCNENAVKCFGTPTSTAAIVNLMLISYIVYK